MLIDMYYLIVDGRETINLVNVELYCHGPDIFLYVYRARRPLPHPQLSTLFLLYPYRSIRIFIPIRFARTFSLFLSSNPVALDNSSPTRLRSIADFSILRVA